MGGGGRRGWRGGGDSRQVRNSTGPPGVGRGYKRACLEDRRNTGNSPRRERGRDKTASAAHRPPGAGPAQAQVTAQVTADALLGPPLCPTPEQQGKDMPWWAA